MQIIYQGVDITDAVDIVSCIYCDRSGASCDSLDIEFDNLKSWHRWRPEENDEIRISHNGISTGKMYLNTILPTDGRYRIVATSLPTNAKKKKTASYIDRTIESIARECAHECGFGSKFNGVNEETLFSYIERQHETPAAFCERLLKLEGAKLKTADSCFCAIDLKYAENRLPAMGYEIEADQEGVDYARGSARYSRLTVKTPFCEASAADTDAADGPAITVSGLPAREVTQAARWAKNLLMDHNRRSETLSIESELNRGFYALSRLKIESLTELDGEWMAEEVKHDLINQRSKVKLLRCISTITNA